nr:VP1 [Kaptombes virus]
MAVVVQDLAWIRGVLELMFDGIKFDGRKAEHFYYKYSKRVSEQFSKYKRGKVKYNEGRKATDDENTTEISAPRGTLYGLKVINELTWERISEKYCNQWKISVTGNGWQELDIYLASVLPLSQLEPEEEFLRNYGITEKCESDVEKFVRQRMRNECAVYGDMGLRHWFHLLCELSYHLEWAPLGLDFLNQLVHKYGAPFKQNMRDLSQISEEIVSSSIVLIFEMSLMESILEFNMLLRLRDEGKTPNLKMSNGERVNYFEIIRELYTVMLPHPKKINNGLRAVYSWFVKCWGTGCQYQTVLESRGGDDRNSKDVAYGKFKKVENQFANLVLHSKFHQQSKRDNIMKMRDVIEYSQKIGRHDKALNSLEKLMLDVYELEFDPTKVEHMILASLLLSIQTMSGYGRAWVVNKGDDPNKIMLPGKENFIDRVAKQTEVNFSLAYQEAERFGYRIVPPHEMYSSLLRLAKNTSSGMSTTVEVAKSYGPKTERKEEVIKITSRQKAMVIMREGDKIYTEENLKRKFNTSEFFQTKGSRDVPIKSTRTIFAIHISVLAPQLILTLPLNEYFAQAGGATTPDTTMLAGKVIIGDLEATGSRLMDASDTFRNTADPNILTLALDYSEYDSHMTYYNFRRGMLTGMKHALSKYNSYRYEGHTIDDLIEFGYGDGRVHNTLWNGKRMVRKMSRAEYENLKEEDRQPPDDAAFAIRTPGVHPIRTSTLIPENVEDEDFVLVSPWDGSDLARVTTHLSGENSTLIANSLHNMAIGRVMQEEISLKVPNTLKVLSEMYVGDDTLFYIAPMTRSVTRIDNAIEVIFDVVKRCGHEASAAKTTFLPFSAEKTQTHAKNGVYIPQDRMMILSSEKPKNIENVQAYMRSNVMTYVTKVSRGFDERLATIFLMYKSAILGYRKMKRTVYSEVFRSRHFLSQEDGYTVCRVRDPGVLFLPVDWHGYGASMNSLNIVSTPELILDMLQMPECVYQAVMLLRLGETTLPCWNETEADKRQIRSHTSMALFSKLARPAVVASLTDEHLSNAVRELPLQGLGPHNLSETMLHSALLKEQRARTLLSPGYELDFQKLLNDGVKPKLIKIYHGDMNIEAGYTKMFNLRYTPIESEIRLGPDLNLSTKFKLQRMVLGVRQTTKMRMSYVDKIDSILRGDVIMRGFITSNMIMRLLEEIGTGHTVEDLSTIFQLMNLDARVAMRLAEYVGKYKIRFDVLKVNRAGIAGDEFSMSLPICTQEMIDKYIVFPHELQQAERDAITLHVSQLIMLRASLGLPPAVFHVDVNEEHKKQIRHARVQARLPSKRRITRLCTDVRNLVASMVEQQFL